MTPLTESERRTFENRRYGARVLMLVPLGGDRFALATNGREALGAGSLLDLLAPIYAYEPKAPAQKAEALTILKGL